MRPNVNVYLGAHLGMAAGLAERWQKLTRQQQLAAVVGGSLMVAWGMDAAALRPLRRQLHRLHDEVRQAEQRLLDALVASQQEASVDRAFTSYKAYADPAGSPEAELADVLSEVESAVRESGMTLLNLKPLAGRSGNTEIISVTVEGESSPDQLVSLLDRIQRLTHLLKVTELSVRTSERQTVRTSMVVGKLLLK